MVNNPTLALRFTRLRDARVLKGRAMSVRFSAGQHYCTGMGFTPVGGLAQGRIVSISRGSPPPKKR